jgi:hypothetical protein
MIAHRRCTATAIVALWTGMLMVGAASSKLYSQDGAGGESSTRDADWLQVRGRRTFGKEGRDDGFKTAVRASDGGFVAVGWSDDEMLVVKVSPALDALWERRFGHEKGRDALGLFVQERKDERYLIVGWTAPPAMPLKDLWLLELDKSGKTLSESLVVLQFLGGGGILLTRKDEIAALTWGVAEGDDPPEPHVSLAVLSDSRKLKFQKALPLEAWTIPRAFAECKGGDFLVGGVVSDSADTTRAALVARVSETGAKKWARTYRLGRRSEALACCETPDGRLLIGGEVTERDRPSALLMMLSADGDLEWHKTFRGSCEDAIFKLVPLKSGGWLATGETCSSGAGKFDMLFCELDSMGGLRRVATLGGAGSEYVEQVLILDDRRFAVVGAWDSEPGKGSGRDDAVILSVEMKSE